MNRIMNITLDYIYDRIDEALFAGEFGFVNEVLKMMPIDRFPVVINLSLSTITLPAKHMLSERPPFMARLRKHLESKPDTKERVEALLEGLE